MLSNFSSLSSLSLYLPTFAFLDLFSYPVFGSFEPRDNIFCLFCEKPVPIGFFLEAFSVANNDQAMLSPSDADVDAVLFLDELARLGPDHGHKDEVKFASLRAVDRQNLIVDLLVCEVLGDCILLCVVRSNHIH